MTVTPLPVSADPHGITRPAAPTEQEKLDTASICHEANRMFCMFIGDPVAPAWSELDADTISGVLEGVNGVLAGDTPWESHTRWVRTRQSQGWVHGDVLDRERRIHPNLVPYAELRPLQRRKDAMFTSIVLSLLGPQE